MDRTWSVAANIFALLGHLLSSAHNAIRSAQPLNTAIWTLRVEIRVSLIFPILFWLTRRLHPALSLGVLAALSAGLPFVRHGNYFEGEVINPLTYHVRAGGILLSASSPLGLSFSSLNRRNEARCLSFDLFPDPRRSPCDQCLVRRRPSSVNIESRRNSSWVSAELAFSSAIHIDLLLGFSTTRFLFASGALLYSTYLMHPTVLFVLIWRFVFPRNVSFLLHHALVPNSVYIVSELFTQVLSVNLQSCSGGASESRKKARRSPRVVVALPSLTAQTLVSPDPQSRPQLPVTPSLQGWAHSARGALPLAARIGSPTPFCHS